MRDTFGSHTVLVMLQIYHLIRFAFTLGRTQTDPEIPGRRWKNLCIVYPIPKLSQNARNITGRFTSGNSSLNYAKVKPNFLNLFFKRAITFRILWPNVIVKQRMHLHACYFCTLHVDKIMHHIYGHKGFITYLIGTDRSRCMFNQSESIYIGEIFPEK